MGMGVSMWVEGTADTEKSGGTLQARMAVFTLRRPPVTRRPASNGIGSTLFNRLFLSAAVSSAQLERTSAAAPETCGAAIDVPLRYWYVLPGNVDRIFTPGAARWTDAAP